MVAVVAHQQRRSAVVMGCLPVGVGVDLHKQKLGAEIDMQNKTARLRPRTDQRPSVRLDGWFVEVDTRLRSLEGQGVSDDGLPVQRHSGILKPTEIQPPSAINAMIRELLRL